MIGHKTQKRKYPNGNNGPEPMVTEVAQKKLVEGEVSESLDEKLEKEYGKEWKEDNTTMFMIPPVFYTNKGTKDSINGAKAEHEVYKALQKINDKPYIGIADYFVRNESIKMSGFVFHGQKFDKEEIDFVYVAKQGVIVSEVKGIQRKSNVQTKYDKAFEQLKRKIPILLKSVGLAADIPVFKLVSFPLLSRCDVEVVDETHVLFKDDLNDLKTWLRRIGFLKEETTLKFEDYVEMARKFLAKYHLKGNFNEFKKRGISDSCDNLERLSKFYTKEQTSLLNEDDFENRWISGGAGTGKTLVLKERAKTLAELYYSDCEKPKILVITYNVPISCDIAEWMKQKTIFKGKLVRVQTFCTLLGHILRAVPESEKTWSNDNLPGNENIIIDYILKNEVLDWYFTSNYTKTSRFNHILVDEAQDLSGNWLSLLQGMLKKNKSNIWIFHDPYQNVRRHTTSPNLRDEVKKFGKRSLAKVFRNTHNIFDAYRHSYEHLRERAVSDPNEQLALPCIAHNVYGLRPEYIPAENDIKLKGELVRTLRNLQCKGVSFSDIAVITSGSKKIISDIKAYLINSDITCANAEDGCKFKYMKKKDPAVIVDSYQRFKGLETKVLIFCIPAEWRYRDEDIYVGFSRAFCHLIVIATAKAIKEIKGGGKQD